MRKISDKAVDAEAISAPAETDETNELKTIDGNQPAFVAATEFAGAAAQVTPESTEHVTEEPARSHNSPSGKEAAPSPDTRNTTPNNQEPSPTDAALGVIEQANGIDRISFNSVVVGAMDKGPQWFSEATPEQLFTLWDNDKQAWFMSYGGRCKIVYWMHKKTAKPGRNGRFHDALRRFGLKRTTGYDMVRNHAISIGELKDEDDSDPRDEEEQQSDWTNEESAKPAKPRPHPAPRVVLVLKDALADAIADIQKRYGCPDAKSAVMECVLSVWLGLSASSAPSGDRKQAPAEVAHESAAA